jgi:hypothetical protein
MDTIRRGGGAEIFVGKEGREQTRWSERTVKVRGQHVKQLMHEESGLQLSGSIAAQLEIEYPARRLTTGVPEELDRRLLQSIPGVEAHSPAIRLKRRAEVNLPI